MSKAKRKQAKGGHRFASKLQAWNGVVARRMWVEVGATETETCQAAQITPTTLRRWRESNDWDALRTAAIFRWADALAELQERLGGIVDELRAADRKDADRVAELVKLMRDVLDAVERIKKIDRDVDYKRLAVKYMRELTRFLGDKDPQALERLLPHVRSFTTEVVRA